MNRCGVQVILGGVGLLLSFVFLLVNRPLLLTEAPTPFIHPTNEADSRDGRLPAPTGLRAERGDTAITLYWQPVPGAVAYAIHRNESEYPLFYVTTGEVVFHDSRLTNGETYRYYVAAIDSAGRIGFLSNAVTVTPAP